MERIFEFIGGKSGPWQVKDFKPVVGKSLASVPYLNILPSPVEKSNEGLWTIRGVRSNLRYTEKTEANKLLAIQEEIGRPEATCAALIPIRKSEEWWTLAQDERREIFEAQSGHINKGMKYLPAIARRLYHCRDFNEEFDFLTWFEFAPKDCNFFEDLVAELRETAEWKYVEREVDIRLYRA